MDVGMVQGKKIIVTGGGGYFGHKLGNELKKMGAVVVSFDISWPLDDVVYEQMECFQVETWSVNYVIHFDYFTKTTPFRSCLCVTDSKIIKYYHGENAWKLFEFAVSHTRWWEVFSKHWTPAILEFSYNFHFTLRMIMWYQELSEFFLKSNDKVKYPFMS